MKVKTAKHEVAEVPSHRDTSHTVSVSDYGDGPEITIRKKLGKDHSADIKAMLFKMFMKAKKDEK